MKTEKTEKTEQTATPAADQAEGGDQSRLDRAEQLADQFAERVASIAGALAYGFFRFTARAREEAEDVWAEAQHIRHGDKS